MEFNQQDLIDTINGSDDVQTEIKQPEQQSENSQHELNQEQENKQEKQPEQQKAPEFNLEDELQKLTNGEIKSKDQLSEILGKAKTLSDLEGQMKTLNEENTNLKAQANTNPFADDFTKRLNDLRKANASQNTIDAFIRINRVDNIDDLSPVDARILSLQIKEGLTSQEAEDYVYGSYKLKNADPDDTDEEAKVRMDTLRLKVDSNADKEFLKTHKAEVSSLPVDNSKIEAEKQQQKHQEHVQTLTPIAKTIANSVVFKEININGKDGEAAVKMDLNYTDESKSLVEQKLLEIVQQNGVTIPNTPEGIKVLNDVAENMYVNLNWKRWLAESTNATEKRVRAEYHNPSSINRGDDNPNKGRTAKEELGQFLLDNG